MSAVVNQTTDETPRQQTWLFDPIDIVRVDVTDLKVIYTLSFSDFMCIRKTITVSREDIFLKWPEVLATLIRHGYRFNVLNGGDRFVHAHLAHYSVPYEKTVEALERRDQSQNGESTANEAIEPTPQKGSRRGASKKQSMN